MDSLRNKLFWKHWQKNGKVIDLSLLPPCASSLRKHTARAYFIAKIWKHANIPMQDIDAFANFSWFPDGSIDWIDCPYPSNVADLFGENQSTIDEDEEDE